MKTLPLVACCLVAWLGTIQAEPVYTPYRPDLAPGSAYMIDARQLHPVQLALGWREVMAKKKLLDAKTPAEVKSYLEHKDVPLVIGPGGVPFLTDGHHTLTALILSKVPDKTAYGHILANWSGLAPAEFWARMEANHFSYLRDAEGHPQPPGALPDGLLGLQHDAYRGLSWGVMKAGGFAERPGVFFQEFLWGDFFRQRIRWDDTDDVAFARAVKEAGGLAHDPVAAGLPGYLPAP